QHWLNVGAKAKSTAPKLYGVNWFRKNAAGKFIWPGFGDNMRVLKWVIERVEGSANATETALGHIPSVQDIDWTGLDFDAATFATITDVNKVEWRQELVLHDELLTKLAHHYLLKCGPALRNCNSNFKAI
ncbi:MAG: phosphoenolpyruvate carboxykinase (GTP), partial [Gammaproteobacteria bacterium]|nr:phosphoenolpyruvate carboxykinase (GTP) [Gammaproteobacteria bacterium]